MMGIVMYLTRTPVYVYSSETTLYTGIASGSTVEMDKSLSFFATNTAFDNLINVINSRETQQEVAIRLLAQHLMLEHYDVRYISKESFIKLKKMTPAYVRSLVVKSARPVRSSGSKPKPVKPVSLPPVQQAQTAEYKIHTVKEKETLYSISRMYGMSVDEISELNGIKDNNLTEGQELKVGTKPAGNTNSPATAVSPDTGTMADSATATTFSFTNLNADSQNSITIPATIKKEDFEKTVENLQAYMASSDTNFVYKLLYFNHPHYSLNSVSKVTVKRIGTSDLVKLKYDSDDPGVCQQTLLLLTEVCVKNYKMVKENRSDAVVKYFEYQVNQASRRLKVGEDKLLKFNEDHNIINYYEQSKAVAIVKENLDVSYHEMRIKLAGRLAAIKRIEEKLGNQKNIQLKSALIIEKRNQLGDINAKIATIETLGATQPIDDQQLVSLKMKSEKLKEEMRTSVNALYDLNNTIDGLPVSTLLNDWLNNVIEYEDTKAGIDVLGDRILEFQKQYAIYAPAGANLKRIEREINVSEQEFLSVLSGLNLAKLKMQDAELSSTIKAIDPPFFPLSPNPTKRKILIIVAALFGFLIVLSTIVATEYFDDTLKNAEKAEKKIGIKAVGIFPKILLKTGSLNFLFITNRLLEMAIQQIDVLIGEKTDLNEPRTILFFSSISNEGKSVTAGNIAWKMKKQGKKVLFLNFSRESLSQTETSQIGYPADYKSVPNTGFVQSKKRTPIFSRMLGYADNRIDVDSPFLQKPENYLDETEYAQYQVNADYFSTLSCRELAERNSYSPQIRPQYIIIEIPPILYYSFPPQMIASADLAILVCRANRVWSDADQGAIDIFKKITVNAPAILINGIELQVIESVLGDLPKKRSRLRRITKNLVRFQFFTRNQV
jgi:LysM repeat protein